MLWIRLYNVTQTQTSLELLAEKMECARMTRADAIVTANPGCLLQMRAGAEIHGTNQQVMHVVELLDRALSRCFLAEANRSSVCLLADQITAPG